MMQRPRAIVLFERLYLGAWALGLIGTVVSWQATAAQLARNPATAELGPGFLYGTTAVRLLLPLILWALIIWRHSTVAKWLALILSVLGAVAVAFAMLRSSGVTSTGGLVGYVAVALQLAGVLMLLRADAQPWFAPDKLDAVA